MPSSSPYPPRTWKQSLRRWLARRPHAQPQLTLGHRTIYVAPSAAGYVLASTLMVLLIASINFQLNLGYALTFLIAGSAASSLWMAHRNLRGVQIRLGSVPPVFTGERATIPVVLQSTHLRREVHALSLTIHRRPDPLAWVHADIPRGQSVTLELGSVPHQRGWHLVPPIAIESRFPLGIFRLWSYWQPQARVLVYPAPESNPPAIRNGNVEDNSHAQLQTTPNGEPDGVRSYQRGDTLRSVVWKKTATALAAGHGDLVVRSSARASSHALWLDAKATGLTDTEAQIARLTAWVLHADAQQWTWGLQLPSGHRIAPASGTHHLHRCLESLAVDSLPRAEISKKFASSP